MFVGFYLISLDTRPDLSDAELAGWPALRQPDYFSRRAYQVPRDGTVVKMLGYMMDGYKFVNDGVPVSMFMLMPSAGHFLHPAHRDPDEMVEVRLRSATVFRSRELVWATGTFERLPTQSREEHSLYALRNASVSPASYKDIANWYGR
jgi:hypothetical protein